MDDRNIEDLKDKAPSPEEWKKIHRMTEYCNRIPADHVPDPYYGGAEGFEYVLDILEDACSGLLISLTQDNWSGYDKQSLVFLWIQFLLWQYLWK